MVLNKVHYCKPFLVLTRDSQRFEKGECNQVTNSANNSNQSSGEAKLLVLWIETDAVNMNYTRKQLGHLVPSFTYMHRSCIDHALIMQVPSRLSNQMSCITCTLAMDQSKPIVWSMVILSQSQTDMSEWYSYLDPSKYLETVWFNMNGSNLKYTYLAKVHRLTTICTKWLQGLLVPS